MADVDVDAEESTSALLSDGDTRFRRHAATQRNIRYWNAYVKSGGVTKTLVDGRDRRSRWWGHITRAGNDDVERLDQEFDGNMRADHVVYSLNKKQRWRLLDAFQEEHGNNSDDESDGIGELDTNDASKSNLDNLDNLDVTVALTDRVRFGADCHKVLQKKTSTSANPELIEARPNRRYLDLNNVLRDDAADGADNVREEGRLRRRVDGSQVDGRRIKKRPKVDGHARRCKCSRCEAQPEVDVWLSSAQLEQMGEKAKPEAPTPADELRYVVEMPIQKRLANKRGVVCESWNKASDHVVKGGKKSGGKSAKALAEEMECVGDEEEEEEWEEEEEDEEEVEGGKDGNKTEYSLQEWMQSNRNYSTSPGYHSTSPKCSGNIKNGHNLDDKPHIRYLEENFTSTKQEEEDDFVVVNDKKEEKVEEVEEEDPFIELILSSGQVEPAYLENLFNADASAKTSTTYFEADSWPRTFVVDISEAAQSRVIEKQKTLCANAFKEEGKTPVVISKSPIDITFNELQLASMSKKKKKAAMNQMKRQKQSNFTTSIQYFPAELPEHYRDVKCFLIFTELRDKNTEDKEEICFKVVLKTNSKVASISEKALNKDADNNNVDIEGFVDAVVDGLFEENLHTAASSDSVPDKGRTLGTNRRKVRKYKGMYQIAPSPKNAVDLLTPKDLDEKVRKMNIAKVDEENKAAKGGVVDKLRGEQYCNICWMSIGPDSDQSEDSAAASALGACVSKGHWFCDSCWRSHLRQQIENGASTLTCPEFDCGSNADFATMLRLLPWKLCNIFLRRMEDRMIVDDVNAKWCPGEGCGCALVIDAEVVEAVPANESLPVSCPCGLVLCFHCLGEQHWPATCEESAIFRDTRVKNGSAVPMFDGSFAGDIVDPYVAKVKQCPHCKKKMEKGDGCDHMSCTCGKSYCWACGQDFDTAHYEEQEGARRWVGCQRDLGVEEMVLEDETTGDEGWYADAMFYRRLRRTHAWKDFKIQNFLKLDYVEKVPYKKSEDIIKQYEILTASRRRLHLLVNEAFQRVVETLQVLEYLQVVRRFRKNKKKENEAVNQSGAQVYLSNHIWFFLSRLLRTLNDGPKSTKATEVEADIKENLNEIKNAVGALRNSF